MFFFATSEKSNAKEENLASQTNQEHNERVKFKSKSKFTEGR